MEPGSENFDQLRKLLALKRHEQPPPGYFDRLSAGVRQRIAAPPFTGGGWWQRRLDSWNLSPALAGGYAVVAGGLLLAGIWFGTQPTRPDDLAREPAVIQPTNVPATAVAVQPVPDKSSTSSPTGLFNPPSLPVQPAEFKR